MQKRMNNILRIKLSIWTSLFVFLLPGAVHAQFADWEINHFHSEITVNEDGSLFVQEVIVADFGIQEKHGIFRFVPVVYKTSTGDRQSIDIEFTHIEMDNAYVPFTTYRSGGNEVVQMGDPNKTISGEHVYEVYYTVERALLYFDDYDELYWNVTGNDNEAVILSSSAFVHLPEGASAEQYTCYVGVYGSTDACGFAQEGDLLAFTAEDALTIAVGFTKGIVPEPTWKDRLMWFLQDNWMGAIPLLLLLGVGLYWFFFGRDPKTGKTVIAQYEPPKGLWAVYAGIILRGRFQRKDIVVMIIDLAAKGFLKIEVTGTRSKKHTFIRLKQTDGLDAPHRLVYNAIFVGANKTATFDGARQRLGTNMRTKLVELLKSELEVQDYYAKRTWFHARVMIMVAMALLGLAFVFWSFMGLTGVVVSVISAIGMVAFSLIASKTSHKGAEARWKLKGLQLFLKTAERYRIEWQEKEREFVELLPYAIAFGMIQYWTKAFAAIHGAGVVDLYFIEAQSMSLLTLEKDLMSLTHAVGTATSPQGTPNTPGSIGGSTGGGFSGGGFGGGGSGSW